MLKQSKQTWIMLAVLLGVGLLVYANTLQVPFYLDDINNIKDNRAVQVRNFQFSKLLAAGTNSFLTNRPVAYISFALNHAVHGMNPTGFHVVNLFIHILAAIFLFLLLNKTLKLANNSMESAQAQIIAFAGALLWLVHPLNTQSVTYIVQRMNSLAALFFLLSLYCYVQGRTVTGRQIQISWLAGAGVAGLLALGTKENSASLPFFILLYEWFFIQNLSKAWLRKKLPVLLGVLAVLGLIAFLYLGTKPLDRILASYSVRDFTLSERVLTQFRVVIFYGSLLFFPYPGRLSLEHDVIISHSFFDPPATFFAMLAILALLALALYLARRERFIAFVILWFLGNLVIESSVIGLELVFEHRTYLPSMFVIPAVVLLMERGLKQKIFWAAIGLVILVFSIWTVERNNQWREPTVFWQDCINKAPLNPRPYTYLGLVLSKKGDIEAAIDQFRKALKINPLFILAHNNLGLALVNQGNMREAEEHLNIASHLEPANARFHNNLGHFYTSLKDYSRARLHLLEALRIDPDYPLAHSNMGYLLMMQERYSEAVVHFQDALNSDPVNENARKSLEIALRKSSQERESIN